MLPVWEIADKLGIPDEYVDYYGKYPAKLKLDLLSQFKTPNLGKLILITALTPMENLRKFNLLSLLQSIASPLILKLKFNEFGISVGKGMSKIQ
jgi:hypothetical protein